MPAPDGNDGIWAQHVPALEAFMAVSTQWRWVPRPDGPSWTPGLDYTGVHHGLVMSGIALTPMQWGEFQVIESAARDVLNEATT